jgi:uncharacterized protein YndB with AHSA1/START domain
MKNQPPIEVVKNQKLVFTDEQMGFHQGWGVCTDQLAAFAATL